ncbi:hypothetical protein EXIGLDRAFT_781545 [Exidia glandulosa HHB12029]|uniref:Uncharacterized protein n=1 Tax=Exidia glandulosa HHB12029 TaxID=1314781 RepID=A0A165B7L7_EXIGL|nr:hypothetical protein EXIGLDRAFT_781545 [Exidia glandulosa HHB12029]
MPAQRSVRHASKPWKHGQSRPCPKEPKSLRTPFLGSFPLPTFFLPKSPVANIVSPSPPVDLGAVSALVAQVWPALLVFTLAVLVWFRSPAKKSSTTTKVSTTTRKASTTKKSTMTPVPISTDDGDDDFTSTEDGDFSTSTDDGDDSFTSTDDPAATSTDDGASPAPTDTDDGDDSEPTSTDGNVLVPTASPVGGDDDTE